MVHFLCQLRIATFSWTRCQALSFCVYCILLWAVLRWFMASLHGSSSKKTGSVCVWVRLEDVVGCWWWSRFTWHRPTSSVHRWTWISGVRLAVQGRGPKRVRPTHRGHGTRRTARCSSSSPSVRSTAAGHRSGHLRWAMGSWPCRVRSGLGAQPCRCWTPAGTGDRSAGASGQTRAGKCSEDRSYAGQRGRSQERPKIHRDFN